MFLKERGLFKTLNFIFIVWFATCLSINVSYAISNDSSKESTAMSSNEQLPDNDKAKSPREIILKDENSAVGQVQDSAPTASRPRFPIPKPSPVPTPAPVQGNEGGSQ